MRKDWFLNLRSLLLSLMLHVVIGMVLFLSLDFKAKPITPPKQVTNVVNAVAVDKNQVDKELKRLQKREEKKRQDELNRQKKLKEQEQKLKTKLENEKNQLAKIKKQKEQEKKRLEQEKLRLKKLKEKEEAERKKKAVEKKRKEEAERKKKATEKKRKEEAERKKKAAEKKRKEEAERKKKAAEKKRKEEALQKQLEEELKAEQERKDLSEIQQYQALIAEAIENRFNRLGLEEGLSCVILIRMIDGGKVVEASIVKSSGNGLFDKRAEDAVFKASPLPIPDETRLFEKIRNIRFTFEP